MLFKPFLQILLLALVLGQEEPAYREKKRVKRLATPSFSEEVIKKVGKCVVSIRSRIPYKYFGDNHFCGGSIISSIFVLTAAHCVMDERKIMRRNRVLLIVAGAPYRLRHILGETLNVPVQQLFVPKNYILHNTNNIGLIKLKYALPNNKHIGVFKLPRGPPEFGISYKVLGWGRLHEGGGLSYKILYIDVKLQNETFCKSLVDSFSSEMLCAGNFNGVDEHPCPGDSGSPFVRDQIVYGVTTYGLGCGKATMPSVYTNVWYHMDWITDIIENNNSRKYYPLPVYLLFQLAVLVIAF